MPNEPRLTKAERREQARLAARRMKEETEQRKRRNRIVSVVAIVLGVFVVASFAVGFWALNKDSDTKIVKPKIATSDNAYLYSQEGVGKDDPSAVRVTLFTDYICPFCSTVETEYSDKLRDYAARGLVTIEYHPLALLDNYSLDAEYSTRSTVASAAVADLQPDRWFAFHDALFENQPPENTTGLSDTEIAEIATNVGVNDATIKKFTDGTYDGWVDQAKKQAIDDGITGTPVVKIDGEDFTNLQDSDAFWAALDAAVEAQGLEPTPTGTAE